jgi:hypothetical protein
MESMQHFFGLLGYQYALTTTLRGIHNFVLVRWQSKSLSGHSMSGHMSNEFPDDGMLGADAL